MIELEDARLATTFEIEHRRGKAALLNTHLAGFDLTQLLDRVNQWCLEPRCRAICIGYRGTFGTLLMLSKHLATFYPDVRLIASVEPETLEPVAFRRLGRDNPNITCCIPGGSTSDIAISDMFKAIDAFVLVPYHDFRRKRFKAFFDEVFNHPLLDRKPCLVADIVRARRTDNRGEYFMGSCIWTVSNRSQY